MYMYISNKNNYRQNYESDNGYSSGHKRHRKGRGKGGGYNINIEY